MKLIKRKLKRGTLAIYVGVARPWVGKVKAVHNTFDGVQVELDLGDGKHGWFPLDRHLVPKAAYKTRSWDGYTILPYEWVL